MWGDRLVSEVESKIRQKGWYFNKKKPLVVAVKGSKVSDFGDKSLNAYSDEANIYLNPLMPSAGDL